MDLSLSCSSFTLNSTHVWLFLLRLCFERVVTNFVGSLFVYFLVLSTCTYVEIYLDLAFALGEKRVLLVSFLQHNVFVTCVTCFHGDHEIATLIDAFPSFDMVIQANDPIPPPPPPKLCKANSQEMLRSVMYLEV